MRVGTPPILQLAALEASLDIWDNVDMAALRRASLALTDQFIAGVEAACRNIGGALRDEGGQPGFGLTFCSPPSKRVKAERDGEAGATRGNCSNPSTAGERTTWPECTKRSWFASISSRS